MNVINLQPNTPTFDDFWEAYPLKVHKADARTLFNQIIKPGGHDTTKAQKDGGVVVGMVPVHLEATPEQLVDGAKQFARSLVKVVDDRYVTNLAYCRHAETWLRHEGWDV